MLGFIFKYYLTLGPNSMIDDGDNGHPLSQHRDRDGTRLPDAVGRGCNSSDFIGNYNPAYYQLDSTTYSLLSIWVQSISQPQHK